MGLQQRQSDQQRFLATVCRVQNEFAVLGVAVVQDRDFLMSWLGHSNEQMLSRLVRKLMEERHQAKTDTYEETRKNSNLYSNGCQS